MSSLDQFIKKNSYGELASFIGRYYAMDRDKRWERVKTAYEGLVQGAGEHTQDILKTLEERYSIGETDGKILLFRE